MTELPLLPATVIGSYPQPDWLIDRVALSSGVPRVRARDLWQVSEESLEQAQDDATLLAIRDQERAGIDVITDGEIRRESYSNRFTNSLEGIDAEHPAQIPSRRGSTAVPRITGRIRRSRPVEVRDLRFLRANTDRTIKVTLPGPFTMSRQAVNEFYRNEETMLEDFAAAVNEEALELQQAGADVIQLDEPWVRNDPDAARRLAVPAIDRALRGIGVTTVVHLCFGYAAVVPGASKPAAYAFLTELTASTAAQISIEAAQPKLDLGVLRDLSDKVVNLGVLDLGYPGIETPEVVAGRLRAALTFMPPEKLVASPDCGMKYLPRDVAFGKLAALAAGAAIVRSDLR
jgi:5-methyltetrahydropteroyltriglutamate--homocysteine methyltransferase